MKIELRKCECEHISHFDQNARSPFGNPNHRYGVQFAIDYMREANTPFGKFNVCKDCSEDCCNLERG